MFVFAMERGVCATLGVNISLHNVTYEYCFYALLWCFYNIMLIKADVRVLRYGVSKSVRFI